jgi:hypothetical protein
MSRGEAFSIKDESLNLMNLLWRDTIGSSLAFSQELYRYLDPFPFQIR